MQAVTARHDIVVEQIPGMQMGGDTYIANAAKVSTGTQLDAGQSPRRLLRSLMRERHWGPFEHGAITLYVEAPIFVLRQWQRSRIAWSYSEASGRYRQFKPEFWIPAPERALIVPDGFKPMRPEFVPGDDPEAVRAYVTAHLVRHADEAWRRYQDMIGRGVALEVARAVLPQSLYTSMWATCNPRSIMHFLSLRTKSDDAVFGGFPQAEIDQAAQKVEALFKTYWPITHEVFCEFGRAAAR